MNKKIAKYIAVPALIAALAASLVGCGPKESGITGLTLPSDLTLGLGETEALKVEYSTEEDVTEEELQEAAADLELTWTSSDETVAAVDAAGIVTAVSEGTANITVKTSAGGNDLEATVPVTVSVLLEGVAVDGELELVLGDETRGSGSVNARLIPEGVTGVTLVYESDNESVATVDENGIVTAVAEGECVVTVEAWSNESLAAAGKTSPEDVIESGTPVGEVDTDGDGVPDMTLSVPDVLDPAMAVVPNSWKAQTKVTVIAPSDTGNVDTSADGTAA